MSKKLSEMTLHELWELFPIVLVEHDPRWADTYREEVEFLKTVLPPDVEFHHVGSTAVDGIYAKPIIDILAAVNSAMQQRETADILQRNGYTVMSATNSRISLNKGYTENGFAKKRYISATNSTNTARSRRSTKSSSFGFGSNTSTTATLTPRQKRNSSKSTRT